MSASNKFFNVILIGILGLAGLFVSLFLLLGTDRATSARYEAGLERLELGDLQGARAAFVLALESSEDKAPPAYQLALMTAREDTDAALPFIETALEEGRPTGQMLSTMTRISLRARDTALAGRLIDRLQETDPGHAELLPLRGGLAVAQRRIADAVSIFEELYSSGSATPEAKFSLGQLLSQSDRVIDQTRAKVILLETARDDSVTGRNAFLYLVATGSVRLSPRDWREVLQLGAERDFLKWETVRTNLPLLRRFMVLASQHYPELGLDIAEVRVEHPEAESVDFLDAAEMALEQRNILRAEQLLGKVPPAERESLGYRLVAAHKQVLEGRPDLGVQTITEILTEAPEDLPTLAILRQLARGDDGLLSVREKIAVYTMIAEHPYALLEERFASYDELLEIRPLGRRELMAAVLKQLGPNAPGPVARWLLRHDEPTLALGLLTEERGRQDPALFELRILALLGAGELDQAAAFLDQPLPLISAGLVQISRLRLAIARGDKERARALWEDALATVESLENTSVLPLLAELAESFEADDLALRAYQLALERGARMTALQWLAFSGLAGPLKDLDLLLRISEAALQAHPDNPVLVNNLAYFQLLKGRDLNANLRRMEELVTNFPGIDAFQVTLGLAYLKNDRASQAVRTIERIELDWSPAGASAQVIYIAALAEGERRAMAENFARNVDMSDLLLEEKELLGALLRN